MGTKNKGIKSKSKSKGSKTSKIPSPEGIKAIEELMGVPGPIDPGPEVDLGLGSDVGDLLQSVTTEDGDELEDVTDQELLEPGPGEGLQPGDMLAQSGTFDPKVGISTQDEIKKGLRKLPSERILQKMEKFTLELRAYGNPTRAAQAAGITRRQAYNWRATYPGFAKVWSMAMNMAIDDLESEARRRAFEGIVKQVGWYKGQAGGKVREYSDLLLMFLLKAYRPDKFKDRIEATGAGVLGIKVQITDYSHATPEPAQIPNSSTDSESKVETSDGEG